MQHYSSRTDLALEAHAGYCAHKGDLDGAELCELNIRGCKVSKLIISTQRASKELCKPTGSYYTLELEKFLSRREIAFSDAAFAVSEVLKMLFADNSFHSFLVACLGNPHITPDAVGPLAADSLIVTRHLKSSLPDAFSAFSSVSVFRTGVLGTTGIESAESIKSLCDAVLPDCVIVIDALASSDASRLCRTVQLCDSGISPGSGVGNDRARIDRDTLGRPVIAVGVPTVIDASSLTDDPDAESYFVTPRNIDELVASVSKLIAYGVDLALHDGLTVSDIDLLIE